MSEETWICEYCNVYGTPMEHDGCHPDQLMKRIAVFKSRFFELESELASRIELSNAWAESATNANKQTRKLETTARALYEALAKASDALAATGIHVPHDDAEKALTAAKPVLFANESKKGK